MTPDLSALSELFARMQQEASELYGIMVGVAALLILGSLMMRVYQADSNPTQLVRSIVATGFTGLAIQAFPDWVNHIQAMAHSWVEALDANPTATHAEFSALIGGASEGEGQPSIWDILWSKDGGLGHAILYAIVFLTANFAFVVMWIFAFIQQFLILLQTALAPPFLAMFLISPLASKAWGFLLNLVSVLLIPLGWAIMHIVTQGLMAWAEGNQIYTVENGSVVVSAQTVFFMLLISIWIVIGTIGAPWMIYRLLNSGANVGSMLLSHFGMSIGGGVAGGLSAAASAHVAGGSKVAVAVAGTVGAAGGTLTAAAGNSSVVMPTMTGVGLGMAMPASSTGEGVNHKAQQIAQKS